MLLSLQTLFWAVVSVDIFCSYWQTLWSGLYIAQFIAHCLSSLFITFSVCDNNRYFYARFYESNVICAKISIYSFVFCYYLLFDSIPTAMFKHRQALHQPNYS